jgi:hypothetical protein
LQRTTLLRTDSTLSGLLCHALADAPARRLLDTLAIHPTFLEERGPRVSRALFSIALGAVLFEQLLRRVPTADAYVAERLAAGKRIVFDHGALRTVRFADRATGALPGGYEAFTRILVPLGYSHADTYPLLKLGMTGRSYAHVDEPELIPQYFVSELHVARFSSTFQRAAWRVFGNSVDPIGAESMQALAQFASEGSACREVSGKALPKIAAAFGRWHQTPRLSDYNVLLRESPEGAWLATEGNAFNHATDRVSDVEALAAQQRSRGRPMKDDVEVSASGRVRQTAFRADLVEREFLRDDGSLERRQVPGSFYEFITRKEFRGRDGRVRLDLGFDSSNAQGIFTMTRSAV